VIKYIDVSLPLTDRLSAWPGDPAFLQEPVRSLEAGDAYAVSRLTLGTHTGTHVDAPAHLLADGRGVDSLSLEILVGRARLVDVGGHARVERDHLEQLDLSDHLRLLLKTRVSGGAEAVGLAPAAAAYLVQIGIKLVGIDGPSIDPEDSADLPAHRALLAAGVVIVEGLDFAEAEPGDYELICLPLRIPGADGAPARAVLRRRP
jgi:arylformamidase